MNCFEHVTFDPNEKIYIASVLRQEPLLSPYCSRAPVPHATLFPESSIFSSMATSCVSTIQRTGRKLDNAAKRFTPLSLFSSHVEKQYQWKNYFCGLTISENNMPEHFVFWRNRSVVSSKDQLVCVYWDVKNLGKDFPRGSDEAFLYAAFSAQSKNGLRSFGQRSDGAHVYEIRAQCEKRILGIEIQESGETPLIFLTTTCNHTGLQKAMSAISRDEIKAYAKTILQKPLVAASLNKM